MVTVSEAKKIIEENSKSLEIISVNLKDTNGYAVAESVIAAVASPPFDQSAMDGYAIKWEKNYLQKAFKIVGESAAGSLFEGELKDGEAVRIFTGAKLPIGADSIVMQEKVLVRENSITINDASLLVGSNVRPIGSQVKKGDVLLEKGNVVNPGAVGILATCCVEKIKVIRKPKIAIIVTGSELIEPGNELKGSQIFESNSVTLLNALKAQQIFEVAVVNVEDNEVRIKNEIEKALAHFDLLLMSGGISVGDYDYAGKALVDLGVKTLFYKIKQKPGKPLFFGKKENSMVFALPGNPAAALTCFYEYVLPFIKMQMGFSHAQPLVVKMPLLENYKKKAGLTLFLKAKLELDGVRLMEGQESYIIKSYSEANCLVVVDEHIEQINSGELVNVHLLPSC